jgi:predicted GNAT family N-acyltransferase
MRVTTFREIAFGSDEYEMERSLRDKVLRRPLGLSLHNEDRAPEKVQWHFGLFAPGGELAACAIAVPLSYAEAKTRQMAVAPVYQGKGLGRELMNALEEHLQARGFTGFVLHARVSAAGFYEKLGYTAIGEEFLEVNIPHLKMEKKTGSSSEIAMRLAFPKTL